MNDTERIEVLRNSEIIISTYLQVIQGAKSEWDYFADVNSLSIVPFAIGSLKKAMLDAKRTRGTRLRFVTEITKDNISYCKETMETVELRHLDGVKGNFGVSDTEYIAISLPATTTTTATDTNLTEPKSTATIIPHAVYSNVKEDIQQQQYVFEILWSKAIPAEAKIREIEEGIVPVRTRLLENQAEIIKEIRRLNNNANGLSVCSSFGGMQMSHRYLFDTYTKIVEEHRKGKGDGMRWIVNIEGKDNLELVRIFGNIGIQIRHVKNMPPMNFGVSDKEVAVTIEKMEGGKMSQSFLISNEPLYLEHFNSIFEELWKNGIDSEERVKDIEAGVDLADIEVIQSPSRARDLYLNLVKFATKQVLLVFATSGAFIRQEKMGVIQLCKEAARERNVKVRILMPADKLTEQSVQELRQNYHQYIDIRYIEATSSTKVTILLLDRRVSLVMELRDDSKATFAEAIGLSTYSNTRSGVLSYVSIFENLWMQTELYQQVKEVNEQLKLHDKMQQDFVNLAAHELRTPIQPILGLVGLLRTRKEHIKEDELEDSLELINRNALRLKRLSEDILDVTRIGSKSLKLKRERLNLPDVISSTIQEIVKNQIDNSMKVQVMFEPQGNDIIFIEADRGRLTQVISNLISNAVKFTKRDGGNISIILQKRDYEGDNSKEEVIVSVKDTGTGIDPEIFPRLFDKFASKSFQGTGLGLFISKSIIDAHGGNIWAENNSDRKGATFYFTLPLVKKSNNRN